MEHGKVGDVIVVEAERVGHPHRQGRVLEVIHSGEDVHYRVRWDDGHESSFFPSGGSVSFRRPVAPA